MTPILAPVGCYVRHLRINGDYHTRLLGRLGVLDRMQMTFPSVDSSAPVQFVDKGSQVYAIIAPPAGQPLAPSQVVDPETRAMVDDEIRAGQLDLIGDLFDP